MTMLKLAKCDGCERTTPITNCDGWWSVHEVVTSEERMEVLLNQARESGVSGALSGDFCSLPCLARWAANAEVTRGMEGGPTYEGFKPEFKPDFPPMLEEDEDNGELT